MMHSFEGLADEISTLLKNRGDTGDRGDNSEKANRNNVLAVTPCRASLSPLEFEGCHLAQSRGDGKGESNQLLAWRVTPVTPVTRNSEHGRQDISSDYQDDQSHVLDAQLKASAGRLPSVWIDVVVRLQAMEIPDCFTAERWRHIVDDADVFLKQWGEVAAKLGWTAHDLFGVHPAAPAVRFDAMGLIPLLQGNRVVALTESTAAIRHGSGTELTFRRGDQSGAILISEVMA